MEKLDKLEKLVLEQKPTVCPDCQAKFFYDGGGVYRCENCGRVELDAFGKVKQYLDEHGAAPTIVLEQKTGVDRKYIEQMLREGRLEIPESSPYFIQCEKCGCDIRYGRFCPECIKELAGGIQAVFHEDMGERPKNSGKMHYLNQKKGS